jgi:hypothetical protein
MDLDDKVNQNRSKIIKKEAVLRRWPLSIILFKLQNQMLKFAVQ